MLVIWHLVHEGEQEADPERVPDMEQDVLILLRLEERNAMDLEFAECPRIERVQQAMDMPAQFFIQT